jgi:Hypothetical protein (DUF2513)
MKLDKDLVREILLQVEASPDPLDWVDITVPGHSEEEIAYHVQILDEADYIEAENLISSSGYDWRAKRLTYEGHEFLDTIRDAEAWRFTKETAKSAGVAGIKALFDIGKSYARQKLIEHGVHLS